MKSKSLLIIEENIIKCEKMPCYNYKKLLFHTKEGFHCISKPVILINSVYKKNEFYYPKVFLEKYYFDKDIEIYSDNSYCRI